MATYTPISIQALTQPTNQVGTKEEIDAANKYMEEQNALMADPYGVQAANSAVTQPITPPPTETKTTSPTVVSTDTMREQLVGAEKSLLDLKAQIEAGNVPQETTDKTGTTTTETTIAGKTGGQTTDPFIAEIQNYQANTTKILNDRKNEFNRYLTRSSQLLKSQIRSIQKAFDVRRNQAQDVANRAMAASTTLGARTGRLRYAPEVQRGIITGQENDLITTLSEIDAMELAAIAAAEGAAYERDYGTFLDQIENLDAIQKERETKLEELNQVMKEENERREVEAERTRQETSVIEQLAAGVTDPIKIFENLQGEVPYDIIKEYTDSVAEETKPIELDRYGLLVDPRTGAIVARGSSVVGGAGVVSQAPGGGASTPGSSTFISKADLDQMNEEERDFVNKVLRQLPTKLKDSENERLDRMKEALFDYRRGRSFQEVVDEMNGYVVTGEDKGLADVFRSFAIGSDVELSQISAAMNNGQPEQAMITVENSKLKDADQFFASPDEARTIVNLSNTIESLINDPSFPKDKLGAFDGRVFLVKKQLDPTEQTKVQQLQTALQTLNSPVRVSLIGTAGTEAEMAKITALQAEITDQPAIIKQKIAQFKQSVLDVHNQARSQRGLPTVSMSQLTSNDARLKMYRGLAKEVEGAQMSTMSNEALFDEVPVGGKMTSEGGSVWGLIGLE